jgi:hypothetical protein
MILNEIERGSDGRYHFIYRTECIDTGKYYIGMHSTYDLEDGYLGSGKIVRRSLKKYGAERHSFLILAFFPNREALSDMERQLVTPSEINSTLCMNLKLGGSGGWDHCSGSGSNNKGNHRMTGNYGWKYREVKEKAPKVKIDVTGAGNSQYGTMWVSDMDKKVSYKLPEDSKISHPIVRGRNVWMKQARKEARKKESLSSKENAKLARKETVTKTFELYQEHQSLRIVAELLGISHIAVRNHLKEYAAI